VRLTNAYRLPQPIYDAVKNDPYSRGDADYSVTGLLRPAQLAALEEKHSEEIVEDAVDRIYSLLGQVIHGILERAETTALAEKRLYMELGGKRISGQMDRIVYHEGLLQDYKFISVKKIKNGASLEYQQQLNFYAELMRRNGYEVKRAELVCILRDWNRYYAKTDRGNYPPNQVAVIDVPLWSRGIVTDLMMERLTAHEAAKKALLEGQAVLPNCSPEERWEQPGGWSIRKIDGKRAFAKGSTESQFQAYAKDPGIPPGSVVHHNATRYIRCEEYCRVSKFCDQWKKDRS
jgi:hypothetical protein